MLMLGVVLALALGVGLYAYVGYPAILKLLSLRARTPGAARRGASNVPRISIVVPVYNEATVIAATLERILAIDYPVDRRQILVVSDASSDGTDEIVAQFASRGIDLLRLPRRQGKTAAENAARPLLTGEIIVNTDASVRVDSGAIRALVAAFADDSVGVASARDVSVTNLAAAQVNGGEGAYVGYEMWIRGLETAVDGIVGASGCLYAIRASLHMLPVREDLSRDFAAALTARENGFRAVSVHEAICYVPRGVSLHQEYRRKVRTITRGLATLAERRALLNPLRYGAFSWMLFSHKVCRWLLPWAAVAALAALGALAITAAWARALLAAAGIVAALAGLGWRWSGNPRLPRALSLPAYLVAGNVAVLHAWLRFFTGRAAPVWEPTRRDALPTS